MPVVFQNELNPFISGPIYQVGGAADPLMQAYNQEMQNYRAEMAVGAGAAASLGQGIGGLAGMTAGDWAYQNKLNDAESKVNASGWDQSVKDQALGQIQLERAMGKGGSQYVGRGLNYAQPWSATDIANSALMITNPATGVASAWIQPGRNAQFEQIRDPYSNTRIPVTPQQAAASATYGPNGELFYQNTAYDVNVVRPQTNEGRMYSPDRVVEMRAYQDYANNYPQFLWGGDGKPYRNPNPMMDEQTFTNQFRQKWGADQVGPPASLAPGALPDKPSNQRIVAPPPGPGTGSEASDVTALPTTSNQNSAVPAQQQAATTQARSDEDRFAEMLGELRRTGRKPQGYDELKKKLSGNK